MKDLARDIALFRRRHGVAIIRSCSVSSERESSGRRGHNFLPAEFKCK